MRVNDFEQRLCEAGELGVELQLDASREKRKAFQQALDVGVRDLDAAHAEPSRHLRKLLRELRTHLADMLQLEVVVPEEPRIHQTARACIRSAISTLPVSRSISVLTRSSSGTGCAQSWPRI